jgi:hypothetical protein
MSRMIPIDMALFGCPHPAPSRAQAWLDVPVWMDLMHFWDVSGSHSRPVEAMGRNPTTEGTVVRGFSLTCW